MVMGFAALNDAALMERLDVLMASCERIMALPAEERRQSRNAGHVAAPQEFGHLQAMMAVSAWEEARKRGLVPDEAIDAV